MAEVRKVRPDKGGHIAQAIAQAMGESVRPITPGGSADPLKKPATGPTPYHLTATSFVVSDAFLLPVAADEDEDADRLMS